MKVDFHSPANCDFFGYGRGFFGLRDELGRAMESKGVHRLVPNYSGGDLGIYFGTLHDELSQYWQRKSKIEYAYTMWEATILSKQMIEALMNFDGVITPSYWCKKVFEENGILGVPIYVVPLGIDPAKWIKKPRIDDGVFRVLWQGTHLMDRKGCQIAMKVFNELNLPDSELILKMNYKYTNGAGPWDIWLHPAMIARDLGIPMNEVNEIRVHSIGDVYAQGIFEQFLSQCDISIYPSMGEGFGLIPLEHMAMGLPVIMADNSGMSMFVNPNYNWPIDCKEKCSTFGAEFGVDYMPDEDQIKQAILWAYNNRDKARELGVMAAEWVRREWTYEKSAAKLLEVIEEIAA